jgi:hypothetical protein
MLCARATLLALVVCLAAAVQKVRLMDIKTLHFERGMKTQGRRSPPVDQISEFPWVNGLYIPDAVDCTNVGMGDDGDPVWECTDKNMPAMYAFKKVAVSCEGYENPEDPFILAGSCGFTYTLKSTAAATEPLYSYTRPSVALNYAVESAGHVASAVALAQEKRELLVFAIFVCVCAIALLFYAVKSCHRHCEAECNGCSGCGAECTPNGCSGCGVKCSPNGCALCARRRRSREGDLDGAAAAEAMKKMEADLDAAKRKMEMDSIRWQREVALARAVATAEAESLAQSARRRGRSRSRGKGSSLRTSSESPETARPPPVYSEPRARVSASPSIAYPQPPAPQQVVVNAPPPPAAASGDGPGFFTGLGIGGIAAYAVSAALSSPPAAPLAGQRQEVRARPAATNPAAAAAPATHASVERGRTVRR